MCEFRFGSIEIYVFDWMGLNNPNTCLVSAYCNGRLQKGLTLFPLRFWEHFRFEHYDLDSWKRIPVIGHRSTPEEGSVRRLIIGLGFLSFHFDYRIKNVCLFWCNGRWPSFADPNPLEADPDFYDWAFGFKGLRVTSSTYGEIIVNGFFWIKTDTDLSWVLGKHQDTDDSLITEAVSKSLSVDVNNLTVHNATLAVDVVFDDIVNALVNVVKSEDWRLSFKEWIVNECLGLERDTVEISNS